MPQALFAKRGSRKLDAVGGQHVVVVERLASFVASLFDATRFLKNAWRPFSASFCETAWFCGCFEKEIATTRFETMFCL